MLTCGPTVIRDLLGLPLPWGVEHPQITVEHPKDLSALGT